MNLKFKTGDVVIATEEFYQLGINNNDYVPAGSLGRIIEDYPSPSVKFDGIPYKYIPVNEVIRKLSPLEILALASDLSL